MIIITNDFFDSLYNWQTLVGSTIGIILPISFWYLKELYEARKEHKRNLIYLEKYIINSINSIYDTRLTLEEFLDKQLKGLKNDIEAREENFYSVDYTFFPFVGKDFVDYKILSINTNSGYLDNQIALVLRNLKDLNITISDLQRQFASTINKNDIIAFLKFNSAFEQKKSYIENLEEFERILKKTMLDKNIKIIISTLVSARTVLSEFGTMGVIKWRRIFVPISFRYFKNKKELNKFKKDAIDRIDEYFKEKIDKEIENLEKQHKIQKKKRGIGEGD